MCCVVLYYSANTNQKKAFLMQNDNSMKKLAEPLFYNE